jgi:Kdo2-lipid IVA lauroyltransferase/acyltransferase
MRLKHKVEYSAFIAFVKLFSALGLYRTRRSAYYLGYFLYYCIPIRKKVIISNLQNAFPNKTKDEIKKLTLKNYQNILITFFELMYIPSLKNEELLQSVTFENIDVFKEKTDKNVPVIMLTGHFGGWEFCMPALRLNLNKTFYILAQAQSNPLTSEFVMRAREVFGNKTILAGISVRQLYETLKNGGAVGVAGDQRGSFEGPRFTFFGRQTALHTGTAAIALKTKCAVVLTAFVRQSDFSYKVYFEDLSFENLPNDNDKKIYELTQRYITFLEKQVTLNPEQYFWMHKIWKY